MPRKKRKHNDDNSDDDDEEYRESNDNNSSNDDDDDDDYNDGNDDDDDDDDDEDFVEEPKPKRKPKSARKVPASVTAPVVGSAITATTTTSTTTTTTASSTAAAVVASWTPSDAASRRRQRSRKSQRKREDDNLSDDEYDNPSQERLTMNGGYAHTLSSKLRISRANRGKAPWNKGGNRSAADRAKISEGVRARNRAILLEKLEKLGMTEEEWDAKKRQIKYLRERLRRAKIKNEKKLQSETQKLIDDVVAETTVSDETGGPKKKAAAAAAAAATKPVEKVNKYAQKLVMAKVKIKKQEPENDGATTKTTNKPQDDNKAKGSRRAVSTKLALPKDNLPEIFARDFNWKYHTFDSSESDSPYDSTCPNGGPGGLICCEICTKNYSSFMSITSKELEEQKIRKLNNEVEELLTILTSARTKLNTAVRAARGQPTRGQPIMRKYANEKSSNTAQNGTTVNQEKPATKKKPPNTEPKATQPSETELFPSLPELKFEALGDGQSSFPSITVDVAQLPPMETFDIGKDAMSSTTKSVAV